LCRSCGLGPLPDVFDPSLLVMLKWPWRISRPPACCGAPRQRSPGRRRGAGLSSPEFMRRALGQMEAEQQRRLRLGSLVPQLVLGHGYLDVVARVRNGCCPSPSPSLVPSRHRPAALLPPPPRMIGSKRAHNAVHLASLRPWTGRWGSQDGRTVHYMGTSPDLLTTQAAHCAAPRCSSGSPLRSR
jgi:hypothetical protein